MAYDEATAERVRRLLARRRGVVERKMMGGLCFMLRGNMCCGVTGDALMVRVGHEAYPREVAKPNVRSLEFGGRRLKGFVLVDPPGFRTERALAAWVQRGIDVAEGLPPK